MNLEDLENDELISLYPKLLKELKRRENLQEKNKENYEKERVHKRTFYPEERNN